MWKVREKFCYEFQDVTVVNTKRSIHTVINKFKCRVPTG
jgi:hypothetical protein